MKKLCTLLLAAGLVFGAATGASAIDFQAKGQWLMGFGVQDTNFIHKTRNADGKKSATNTDDKFGAVQRLRLQLDAVASESLSGTVGFEIGTTTWGQAESGGALGADATNVIRLKRAYIDWMVPETDLKFRMGIQGVTLPNVAGGSAVMDTDVAAITANYKFNDAVSLTALWARPLNDNFDGNRTIGRHDSNRAGYLDNLDLFSLMVPVTLDGFSITPWAMLGMKGANSMEGIAKWQGRNSENGFSTRDGNPNYSLYPYPGLAGRNNIGGTSKGYGTLFWAGLPFAITAFDPLNIEVDLNYGYSEPNAPAPSVRAGWQRPLWNTRWTGVFPASSAGMAPATTATPRTVPSACLPSCPWATSPPSWATATTAGPGRTSALTIPAPGASAFRSAT